MTTTATSAATSAADFPRLLADVGGTNALRAGKRAAPLRPGQRLPGGGLPSLEAAIRRFRQRRRRCGAAPCRRGPGQSDHRRTGGLTNHNWAFSIEGMRRSLAWTSCWRSTISPRWHWRCRTCPSRAWPSSAGAAQLGAPCALVGPAPAWASGLVPGHAGAPPALAGEGGHIGLTPETDDEWVAWRAAQRAFGHVRPSACCPAAGCRASMPRWPQKRVPPAGAAVAGPGHRRRPAARRPAVPAQLPCLLRAARLGGRRYRAGAGARRRLSRRGHRAALRRCAAGLAPVRTLRRQGAHARLPVGVADPCHHGGISRLVGLSAALAQALQDGG